MSDPRVPLLLRSPAIVFSTLLSDEEIAKKQVSSVILVIVCVQRYMFMHL